MALAVYNLAEGPGVALAAGKVAPGLVNGQIFFIIRVLPDLFIEPGCFI
jgi:hypothetical protein